MQKETVTILKRRGIFALLIILCAVLQNTDGYFPTVFGAHFFILIPLCVTIAVFEGEVWGAVFGIFAGALWDVVRGTGDGTNTLFLFIVCAVCGLLVHHLMQTNFVTAFALSAVSCFLFSLLYAMFFISAKGIEGTAYLLARYYLPSAVISSALTVIFFPIVKRVSKKFAVEY